MKFADKYEIVEMVTSGRVTTFLAREKNTQEPVVVYTFEVAGVGASELSTASIIARFCSLAPNPPGIIVKAGFDQPSSAAFLATKMPDEPAMQAWIAAYHAFSPGGTKPSKPPEDATAELNAAEVGSALAQRDGEQSANEDPGSVTGAFGGGSRIGGSSGTTGEFTRIFRELNAFEPMRASKPVEAPPPSDATGAMFQGALGEMPRGESSARHPAPPAQAESSPGAFTREFMGLAELKQEDQPKPMAAPPPKPPGPFTREFLALSHQGLQGADQPTAGKVSSPGVSSLAMSSTFDRSPDFSAGGMTSTAPEPASSENGGTGEFTRFFGNPFDNPGESRKPIEVPDLMNSEPVTPPAGEFTRVFGSGDLQQASPPPTLDEDRPAPGTFTQIFSESPSGRGSQLGNSALDTHPNIRQSLPEREPAAPPVPVASRVTSPLPPVVPVDSFPPQPVVTAPHGPDSPFMNRSGGSGATEIFRTPGDSAPPVEEPPSGPSEFTMFLSRSQLNAALSPTEPPVAAPPPVPPPMPQPPAFQFAPPPLPKPPAITYQPPAVPAPPPVPKLAMPAAATARAGSLWPLITVLTVLVAIGVILVMYFVMKH